MGEKQRANSLLVEKLIRNVKISSNLLNSSVSSKILSERAKLAFNVLGKISGEDNVSSDHTEKQLLLVKMMKDNPQFFKNAIEAAGLREQEKISVKDAINIKALVRLSMITKYVIFGPV